MRGRTTSSCSVGPANACRRFAISSLRATWWQTLSTLRCSHAAFGKACRATPLEQASIDRNGSRSAGRTLDFGGPLLSSNLRTPTTDIRDWQCRPQAVADQRPLAGARRWPLTSRQLSVLTELAILSRPPCGGTLTQCDPFGIPSTSHWTAAAIIVQRSRTKTCIVTRSRTSPGPMPSSMPSFLGE